MNMIPKSSFALTLLSIVTLSATPVINAQETDSMTADERRAYIEGLPEEERQALRDTRRAESDARRAATRAQYESMSDEEKAAFRDQKRAESNVKREEMRARHEAMTDEEKQQRRDRAHARRDEARANWDTMTPEQRRSMRDSRQQKTPANRRPENAGKGGNPNKV